MLSQIISELFTTLNDLSLTRPTHKAQNKKNRERGTQAIITTLPRHCHEAREQPMKGPLMTGIPKPGGSGPEGFHLILHQVGVVPGP
jgi:hypothetical protein